MRRKDAAVTALAALAQGTRLDIVRSLASAGDAGMSAGSIADVVGVSPSNLSFHLKELEHAGLISSKRHARSIVYAVERKNVEALVAFLREHCCAKAQQ